jgi:hypothetical protein
MHARPSIGRAKQARGSVAVAYLCDADGPPGSREVLPGNRPAPRPLAAPLAQVQRRCGAPESPCGGGRGMSKGQQSDDLGQHGVHAMTAMTQPPREQRLRTGTFAMALCEQELAQVLTAEGIRSVPRRHPVRACASRQGHPARDPGAAPGPGRPAAPGPPRPAARQCPGDGAEARGPRHNPAPRCLGRADPRGAPQHADRQATGTARSRPTRWLRGAAHCPDATASPPRAGA